MKACWVFEVSSGAKPHVVWRMEAIVLPFSTLTSGPSTGFFLDRKVYLPLSGSFVMMLRQQGRGRS